MLADLLLQHVSIDDGVQGHEGRAEAGAEGRLGLDDAAFGAGHLGRVAGQEVVGGLLGGQLGDRGQHAERVGGEHNDMPRMTAHAGADDVG